MYMFTNVVLHPVEMFDQVNYVRYSYKIDNVVLVDLIVIFMNCFGQLTNIAILLSKF